jgi:hypothetical protein
MLLFARPGGFEAAATGRETDGKSARRFFRLFSFKGSKS